MELAGTNGNSTRKRLKTLRYLVLNIKTTPILTVARRIFDIFCQEAVFRLYVRG